MQLAGRTVLLTGASGGIGTALVAQLVNRGARVVAVGRDAARLAPLVARHGGDAVLPLVADVASADGRAALLACARALRPAPSVLVLAHGRDGFGLFVDQPEAELALLVETNLVAPLLLVRALLPQLQAQPDAAVVAIGSTFGSLAYPGYAAYSAAKFGLRGLMEGLAREHAGTGVRFQHLAPRATRTALNPPAVEAMHHELGTRVDAPGAVAAQLVAAIVRGDRRLQLGWPEKFFARLNGALPALVDRSLATQLPIIRRHAGDNLSPTPTTLSLETHHDLASR